MTLIAFINWHFFFFCFFAIIACGFAAGVLFSQNIVRMAFYLVLSLGATAGLFFLAGHEFVGSMQLMIYVGGTLVLLIFGVMLTAQKSFVSMKTGGGDWIIAMILGSTLLFALLVAAFGVKSWRTNVADREIQRKDVEDTARIGGKLMGLSIDKLDKQESGDESEIGGMVGYLLPFEIASVHLLVVLIGAGYMARTKRRAKEAGNSA